MAIDEHEYASGNAVRRIVEAQRIERTLRRAIEVVECPIWEQEWDRMFRRDELIQELEELARRPGELLAAASEGRAAGIVARKLRERLRASEQRAERSEHDARQLQLRVEAAETDLKHAQAKLAKARRRRAGRATRALRAGQAGPSIASAAARQSPGSSLRELQRGGKW